MKAEEKEDIAGSFEQSESENIISVILYKYVPFWPFFVLTILIGLLCSWVYLRYQVPIYSASSSLLIKDDNKGIDGSKVLEALDVFGSKKIVENEIVILKSHALMQEVVKELGLYAQVNEDGSVLDHLAYVSSPVSFIALDPNSVKNSKRIPFKYLEKERVVIMGGKRYPIEKPVRTPYGIFRINLNVNKIRKPYKPLFLVLVNVKTVAKRFAANLSVAAASKQSTVITLGLEDPVPQRAENILNRLVKVYNAAGIEDKNQVAAQSLVFIEKRLKLLKGDLSKVEGDIQTYKSKEGIVDVSEEGKLFLENVGDNDKRLSEVQIQLSVLDQVEKYIVKKDNGAGIVPSTVGISDPILNSLLEKLYTNELELDRLKKVAGENSPSFVALVSQINQIKPSLLENVKNLRQNLLATQRKIKEESGRYTSMLKEVPKKERSLLEISREQFIKNSIYTFLLQKREEAALSYASAVADSRLIDSAEFAAAPIRPVRSLIYLVGLGIGVIVGVLFVLIRESYNQEVLFRTEIDKAVGAPVLAEILHDESNNTLVIGHGKRTVIAEQFRSLRTSLSYIGINDEHKVVLFTSSISGEGKSFMSINLAVSLALTGKKVALMEFDLRKPKITSMLNMSTEAGITNYLVGLSSIDDILLPVPDVANLTLIPCGVVPPNPTELILNGKLDALMDRLKQDYDYILIDTAPVGLVTDAKLLNKYTDATLYMIRHKYTPKAYLKMINQVYKNKELKSMNIIFNGLKPRGFTGQGYGNGYGYNGSYGYGYGYGYGYTDEIKTNEGFLTKLGNTIRKVLTGK